MRCDEATRETLLAFSLQPSGIICSLSTQRRPSLIPLLEHHMGVSLLVLQDRFFRLPGARSEDKPHDRFLPIPSSINRVDHLVPPPSYSLVRFPPIHPICPLIHSASSFTPLPPPHGPCKLASKHIGQWRNTMLLIRLSGRFVGLVHRIDRRCKQRQSAQGQMVRPGKGEDYS
jgi:hypothetical protein